MEKVLEAVINTHADFLSNGVEMHSVIVLNFMFAIDSRIHRVRLVQRAVSPLYVLSRTVRAAAHAVFDATLPPGDPWGGLANRLFTLVGSQQRLLR